MKNGLKNSQLICKLADYCQASKNEKILDMWLHYGKAITIENLLFIMPDGEHKGKSILWLLADALSIGITEPFMQVWQKYKAQLPLETLTHSLDSGSDRGVSILWLLAFASSDYPQAFIDVFEYHQNNISLEELLVRAQEGENKEIYALWSLADAASRGSTEAFKLVWPKVKCKIRSVHLFLPIESKDNSRISILWLLAYAVNAGYDDTAAIFNEMLSQIPGVISDNKVQEKDGTQVTLTNLLEELDNGKKWIDLILVRNTFFEELKSCRKQQVVTQALIDKTELADKAGYINAYYHLGFSYLRLGRMDWAYWYFTKTSSESRYIQKIYAFCGNRNYQLAILDLNRGTKKQKLLDALYYALRITDKSDKVKYIQKIASLHILNTAEPDCYPVPTDLIESWDEKSDPLVCFNRFDEIKRHHALIAENQSLKLDLAEKAIRVSVLQQKLQSSIMPAYHLKLSLTRAEEGPGTPENFNDIYYPFQL